MHVGALTPSPYLAASDFGVTYPANPTFRIMGEEFADLPSLKPGARSADTEVKGLIRLEDAKPWIANKTNAKLIAAMFGDETNDWRGKRVTLAAVTEDVSGVPTLVIRVAGSPDMEKAKMSVTLKFRGKRPRAYELARTGGERRPADSRLADPDPYAGLRTRLEAVGIRLDDALEYADTVGIAHDTSDRRRDLYTALTTEGEHKVAFADMLATRGGGQ